MDSSGYIKVTLHYNKKTNNSSIHRLIATAFIPNPDNKPTVDHIDRNRSNNNIINLRWATSKEQNNNKNKPHKQEKIIDQRKIIRINPNNKNDIFIFDNIEKAIDFIIENKLNKNRKETKLRLISHLYLKNNNDKKYNCYGYKWKFMQIEDLKNEKWKNLRNIYSNAKDYSISNMGRIKNNVYGNIIMGSINGYDYYVINVKMKNINKILLIHRLVAKLFIPNPDNKKVVNHKDGNKLNNALSNLEWNTLSENTIHAVEVLDCYDHKIKVINLETLEETIYMNKKEVKNKLTIGYNTLRKYLKLNKPYKNMLYVKFKPDIKEDKNYLLNLHKEIKPLKDKTIKISISKKIKVINIKTKEEIIYENKVHVERDLKISYKKIMEHIISKEPYNNMIFEKYNLNINENKEDLLKLKKVEKNKQHISKRVKVINIETKDEIIYKSQHDIENKLHIADKTIIKYMKLNKPYKGMLFIKVG
jgi:hypothetical protein